MKRIREDNVNTEDYFNDRFNDKGDYYENPWKNLMDYDSCYDLGVFDGGTILDYGCGSGSHLDALYRNQGTHSIGIDISGSIINKNRSLYSDVDFYTLKEFNDDVLRDRNDIDHIVSTHVIEYVEDPLHVVSKLLKIVNRTVTIITPYKKSWSECEEHLWEFDEESFSMMVPKPVVVVGKTNHAGNTEIMYHFDKNEDDLLHKRNIVKSAKKWPYWRYKIYWGIRRHFPENIKERVKMVFNYKIIMQKILARSVLRNVWGKGVYFLTSKALKKYGRQGKKIFQIVGVPRSGTTMLSMAIDGVDNAACITEPYLSWLTTGHIDYKEKTGKVTRSYSSPHKLIKKLIQNNDLECVGFKETFRLMSHPTVPTEDFIISNYRSGSLDRTIAIIRDPRDVWSSVVSRYSDRNGIPSLEFVCKTWNVFSQWVIDDDVYFVRYEDFVLNPSGVFMDVAQYLGLSENFEELIIRPSIGYGDERAARGGKIFSSSVGKYKNNLNAGEAEDIERLCLELMEQFDYA